MSPTDIEEEIILLKAVKSSIDSMVNLHMFELYGDDPETNILFHSEIHQKLFNIFLVDFLSHTDIKAPVRQTSYLGALKKITKSPNFSINGSHELLHKTTNDFYDWLEQDFEVNNIWLSSIEIETSLKLSRRTFIKMCGNISKHNYLRLIRVADDLIKVLSRCGVRISLEESILALDDFYQWFHTDILNYHASTLAEFLNNIRWGIYEYLQPQYQQSIVRDNDDPLIYRYTYPKGLESKLAKEYYWALMNEVRNPPFVRRFQVTKWLKKRY